MSSERKGKTKTKPSLIGEGRIVAWVGIETVELSGVGTGELRRGAGFKMEGMVGYDTSRRWSRLKTCVVSLDFYFSLGAGYRKVL